MIGAAAVCPTLKASKVQLGKSTRRGANDKLFTGCHDRQYVGHW